MPESLVTYLQGIFIISLTGTVTQALVCASSKNTKTLESALKLVFSLCLILSVIIPGANILKNTDFSNMFDIHGNNTLSLEEQNIISLTKKQLENDVSQKIYQKFGIKPTDVCIDFVTEENEKEINVDIESVNILLSQSDAESEIKVNEYVNSLLGLNHISDGEELP